MVTHRIDLQTANGERVRMFYRGERVGGITGEPLFAAARYLLSHGLAEPGDRIETWRGDVMSMAGLVWAAAKLTVEDVAYRLWRKRPSRRLA